MPSKFIIITSINYPTQAIKSFSQYDDWQLIVVADKKTPQDWHCENVKFLTVEEQESLPFETVALLPWNHYARKNLGYLYAMMQGAEFIYETDDDNLPYPSWHQLLPKNENIQAVASAKPKKFTNAYLHFCEDKVWPRGFPLSAILETTSLKEDLTPLTVSRHTAPIVQGLADLEPDVDAIYRLTVGQQIKFSDNTPLFIGSDTYCPFNSQNTFWYPEAFQYLFLPAFIPSRVTDIWRGYIVQRFLHQKDQGLLFCSPSVYQERNYHNLMRDFEEELDLYTKTEQLITALDAYNEDFAGVIQYLSKHNFFPSQDVALFNAWLNDLKGMGLSLM